MTHPLAPIGCIVCGSNAVIASITIERNGVLGHYPTCRDHIEPSVRRVTDDLPERVVVHHSVEAIDAIEVGETHE